jgi:hypothetical protein
MLLARQAKSAADGLVFGVIPGRWSSECLRSPGLPIT